MPRTRSLAWSELKIGLLSLVAFAMAMGLMFLLSGEGGFFWQRYTIKTVFPNIAGLKAGAPVRVAGVEVGSVTETPFVGDRVEVIMEVNRDMQSRITDASVASLGSVSLLGEAAVDITSSSQGAPIPDYGYVKSGPTPGSLTEVASQATGGIQELTALLRDIRAGRGTVGQLFSNDTLYREMSALIASAEQVTRSISQGRGTLGRLARDPAAAQALEASLKNFEVVTARLRAGGEPREAPERRCAREVADVHHHQPGDDYRPHQQGRRDGGKAADGPRAVRPAELDVRASRQGDDGARAG